MNIFKNACSALKMKTFASVFGMGLLVASCGDRPSGTDAPSDGGEAAVTSGTARGADDRFEFLSYASNTEAIAPELCLRFSAALDPDADYSAYVDAGATMSLSVDGARLCLGGLAYGQTRDVTLRKGLPSAAGDELARDETIALSFDDRPPVVTFSGDGIILPRAEADGLAITTVNVDAVDVTVHRVNDRALVLRAITNGFSAGADDYYYSYGDDTPGEFGELIWQGTMDTDGPVNGTVTTVFPFVDAIGDVEAGAYYVEINDTSPARQNDWRVARAGRWIISTDLALTSYQGASGADVVVRSLQTAGVIGGVEVHLIAQSNEVLAELVTDRNGRLHIDGPLMNGTGANRPKLLLAYGADGDFAMLDLDRAPVDLSVHPVSGRTRSGAVDAYTYLDRGIYRPGETVQASLLLRDDESRAVTDRAGALVLYKPNGLEHARLRFDDVDQAGGLSHSFDLPPSAVRGTWRLAAEVDGMGTLRSTYFSVEDFVPQRIEIDLTADLDAPLTNADPRMIDVTARFLYGAPGAGLSVDGTARVQRDPGAFPMWEGFTFGLHDESFRETLRTLPAVITDGAGRAAIPVSAGRDAAASTLPLRVRAVVDVEEPGGRTVADDVRIPYRPREVYYGLKSGAEARAAANEPVSFDVVAVDRLGAAMGAEVDWRLVRRDYDYDWYRVDGGRWQWRRSERVVPIETGLIRPGFDGAATLETPSLDWGDYRLILAVDGEDVASSAFWVGWGGYTEDGEEAPDEVRVSATEDTARAGGEMRVAIKPPYAGRADVVVATDRVLEVRQIDIPEAGTVISLPVTEAWGGGAYVMVTVHTPRNATSQPRPRRAVGVTHIPVNVDDRRMEVALDLPEKIDPDQTLSIPVEVSGDTSGGVFVTVAAVDEGILQLTKFASPDPEDWFFGKLALGVRLHDDYGRLLDPNQGAAAAIRSGGDQIGGAGLTVVPTKTVALFSGTVALGRNGKGTVELDVPDFNGKLRVMAVAWSGGGIGAADHGLVVRDAVPAELIMPRFLAPSDEAMATLTLDNVEGEVGAYAVALSGDGPVTFAEPSLTVDLQQGQRTDQQVTMSAGAAGIAEIGLSVEGPGEFTAASVYPIQVRPAHWPQTRVEQIQLAPGENFTPSADALAGFVPMSGAVQVTAAATPIDTASMFSSLYSYPYACTEQLSSRMMPLLYSEQLLSLAGQQGDAGGRQDVQDAIETLLSRQSADGSFGLWRIGDAAASPWLGAYATDFLTRAASAGHPVPEAAIARALDALDPIADGRMGRAYGYDTDTPNPRWSSDTRDRKAHRSGAYALYVLARNGRGDRSRLRYMHDELRDDIESPLAVAHIGAGLAAMGDMTRARSAFATAVGKLGYENSGDWYQTPTRDLAGVIALAAEAGVDEAVTGLIPRLQRERRSANQMSIQEKAFVILAARAMAGDQADVSIGYDGDADSPRSVWFTDLDIGEAGTFTNTGDRPIFLTMRAEGAPLDAPAATSADVTVRKRVSTLNGGAVDLGNLAQGDRLVVSVEVEPQRLALAQYMLVDLLPAGFEIEALIRPDEAGDEGAYSFLESVSRAKMAEARDDRFVAAFSGTSRQPVRFAYLVRAVTSGSFTMPGAVVEDMYAPDVFGRSAAGQVVITP